MNDLKRVMVMLHFIDGGKVLSKRSGATNWDEDDYPDWNWLHNDYMIAPE